MAQNLQEAIVNAIVPPTVDSVLYTLYYRKGDNPHPQFLFCWLPTQDMKFVADRVKKHCEAMNYRFVYVRPTIVDLDKAEKSAL
jgi:hypothetical protein